MHVGGLEDELLLGEGGNAKVVRERAERAGGAEAKHGAAVHDHPPELVMVASAGQTR
jgi:hypothetical protein